ncbi:SRPBCC family protein [Nocardia camponoti]|uniref:Polyketide cyclase n=1 Tax=Nocardia camponoti TaxID=1616106 RepID=A0A917QHH7_9NOCA|nr:SRPBCC family protein [Nocardia camponoti]GGK51517.1 polyketide cyclase [Nocardia camponoti]
MPNNLEASIDIAASPEKVWAVLSDLRRMPELSPPTFKVLTSRNPKPGSFMVNVNKVSWWKIYPTTSRVVRFEPNKAIAFKMNENGTTWTYELTPTATGGTHVVETRTVGPKGLPKWLLVAINALMGGEKQFESDLTRGMEETLAKLKTIAEH